MNSFKALFLSGFVAMSLSGASFGNETDHVANQDTVGVAFAAVIADPEDTRNQILNLSLQNDAAVSLILRSVSGEAGSFKMMVKRKFFGKLVWADSKFIQINPGKTLSFNGETHKLIAPKGYTSGAELVFDFGIKGSVTAASN